MSVPQSKLRPQEALRAHPELFSQNGKSPGGKFIWRLLENEGGG
jgi:hypothetical protein